MQCTPVANYDDALDLIEHVNQDHIGELIAIVKSLYPNMNTKDAQLVDLFEDAVLIGVYEGDQHQRKDILVPFEIQGTLEEKLFHLAYVHGDTGAAQKTIVRFLTVQKTESITPNFIRVTVQSEQIFPYDWAGLCFSVHLKKLKRKPKLRQNESWFSKMLAYGYRGLSIFLMKVLPIKARRNMIENSRQGVRAYTLSNQWKQSINGKTQQFGSIDIFTHGASSGSRWAAALKPGDIIYTSSDHPDKHPALEQGRNVIFCDETAYPAAAGLLALWKNPIPPTLIVISQIKSEQRYFKNHTLPPNTAIREIVCAHEEQGDRVIELLATLDDFDTVWGAMELKAAKKVRHYLRNTCKLKGENNLVKPYWRGDP